MIEFTPRDNGRIEIDADYDFDLFQELKKVDDAFYDVENETWEIGDKFLKSLIKELDRMNVDISSGVKLLPSITEHEEYHWNIDEEIVKTVRISVKENKKSLSIGFDYDPTVLDTIKSLEQRTFNPNNKTWRVNKEDADWLYNRLDELKYVELSSLKPHTSHNSKEEVSLTKADFPHITITPREFQMNTVNRIVNSGKVINALEAGLGKTPITVMACEYFNKKTLVVCPATIKYNWKNEIHKINPHANVVVLDGKSDWQDADYIVMNYDIIDRFIDDIMESEIAIAVYDEAHKLRGITNSGRPSSKRAELCLGIAEHMEHVLPITATPYVNQTKDIFNLLKVVEHPAAKNWYSFANAYCGAKRNSFGVTYNGSSNQEQLNSRLYPDYMIRLRTEDHEDLPERMRSFIPLKINMNKYNKAVQDYMDNLKSLETNGQHLVYMQAMRLELAKEKSKQAVNMIRDLLEQNKSVVVFSNYKNVVDKLHEKFERDAVKIHGDLTDKERAGAVDKFQSGDKKVFVGSVDAASEGITLTKSHHMLVIDFHWSPIIMVEQMEKRIHRMTQTQPCIVQYLYVQEAEIDRIQLSMLEDKLNDASMIIDGKKEEFFTDKIIKEIINI